jgi:hypothetical protein
MSAHSLLVKQLECIACEIEGVRQATPTEAHHCNVGGKAGQKRRGDAYQLPLCAHHHRGEPPPGMSKTQAVHKYGPSLALDSRQFRFAYGSDDQLLALTNTKLESLCPTTA